MKKMFFALILSISSVFQTYSYTTYTIEEPVEYLYEEPIEVIYEEEEEILEPLFVRPIIRERIVYRQPRKVVRHHYVEADPVASIFSGLAGFAAGAAIGSAIAN